MILANIKRYKQVLFSSPGVDAPVVRWGIVVVVVIVFFGLIYEPFLSWKSDRLELLASRAVEQAKLRNLTQSGGDWQKAKQLYTDQFSKRAEKLFQHTATVSLGKVQQIVSNLAKQNHLKLIAQKSYDAVPYPGLGMRLPISFTLLGRTDDTIRFIAAVAAYPKLLVFDDVRINRQAKGLAQLSIRLNGYMLEMLDE